MKRFLIIFLILVLIGSVPAYANNNSNNIFDDIFNFFKTIFTSKINLKPQLAPFRIEQEPAECSTCSCSDPECRFCPQCAGQGGGGPLVTNCIWFFGDEPYGAYYNGHSQCTSDLPGAVANGRIAINNDNTGFSNTYLCGNPDLWCVIVAGSEADNHQNEGYRYCGNDQCETQNGENTNNCPLNDCEEEPPQCGGTDISCGIYPNCQDCNLDDCKPGDGFSCEFYNNDQGKIHEIGSDYSCQGNENGCGLTGAKHCNPLGAPGYWPCNPTFECTTRLCGSSAPNTYTCFNDNDPITSDWKWAGGSLGIYLPVSETNCEDSYDNDCDGFIDNSDNDCGCVVPFAGMQISQNTKFCEGTYNLNDGVDIISSDVTLDCNNAFLIGPGIEDLDKVGISIDSIWYNNVNIKNCNLGGWFYGIRVGNADSISISNTQASNNLWAGILLSRSRSSSVIDSITNNNGNAGIFSSDEYTILRRNSANNNGENGIWISGNGGNDVGNAIIEDNTANGNKRGIYMLFNYDNSIIQRNTASNNALTGIHLHQGDNTVVRDNTAFGNNYADISCDTNFGNEFFNNNCETTHNLNCNPQAACVGGAFGGENPSAVQDFFAKIFKFVTNLFS